MHTVHTQWEPEAPMPESMGTRGGGPSWCPALLPPGAPLPPPPSPALEGRAVAHTEHTLLFKSLSTVQVVHAHLASATIASLNFDSDAPCGASASCMRALAADPWGSAVPHASHFVAAMGFFRVHCQKKKHMTWRDEGGGAYARACHTKAASQTGAKRAITSRYALCLLQ